MAVKQFPNDYPDITGTADKVLGAKPDGTMGRVSVRPGGPTLADVVAANGYNPYLLVMTKNQALVFANDADQNKWGIRNMEENGTNRLRFGSAAYDDILNMLQNGNVGIKKNNPTEAMDVNGNIKASGTVSGTVFNPTSLRSKKRDIREFDEDALKQINALKLHTYHFREFQEVEVLPAVIEDGELVSSPIYKQQEIKPKNQQLNVGVIIDEIDNPLIADQEKGVLNLNNIVFLQAKAIQQLTARLEALESK